MLFYQWYAQAQQQARQHQIPVSELDWLILAFLESDKLQLRLQQLQPTTAQLQQLQALWTSRLRDRLPVQYLIGKTNWRDLELWVTPDVLIPRPETEILIDLVLAARKSLPPCSPEIWLDLGTGSGAIAIGLAKSLPQAKIHGIDLSAAALAIAQKNALLNQLEHRIQWHLGSWFAPMAAWRGEICGMVSNPPYIPKLTVQTLEPEVRCHEPHLALDGGADGLEALRQLVDQAPAYLIPQGFWLVEFMQGQAEAVRSLLIEQGNYDQIQIHQDYYDCPRFISARIATE